MTSEESQIAQAREALKQRGLTPCDLLKSSREAAESKIVDAIKAVMANYHEETGEHITGVVVEFQSFVAYDKNSRAHVSRVILTGVELSYQEGK